MGRSKFPGKPSKLVTKKRVSVLNSGLSGPFSDNASELDADYPSGDHQDGSESELTTTTTTQTTSESKNDGDSQVRKTIIFQ